MPKYSTDEVVEIIKNLTNEQKIELQNKITKALVVSPQETSAHSARHSISGVTISDSRYIDISQSETQGGSLIQGKAQGSLQNQNLQEALEILGNIKQFISSNNEINPLIKGGADREIDVIQQELQKPQPDPTFLDQAISKLKKGLSGIEELSKPVMRVSEMIAKAWGF